MYQLYVPYSLSLSPHISFPLSCDTFHTYMTHDSYSHTFSLCPFLTVTLSYRCDLSFSPFKYTYVTFSLSLSLSLPPPTLSQVTELRGMVEHQRYLRLQHLLERSTIYSRFLLKQMEDQRDKEQKEEEKRQKKNTSKPTKEKVV